MSAWSALLGKKEASSVSSEGKRAGFKSGARSRQGMEGGHQRFAPVVSGPTIPARACFIQYLPGNFCFSYGFPNSTPGVSKGQTQPGGRGTAPRGQAIRPCYSHTQGVSGLTGLSSQNRTATQILVSLALKHSGTSEWTGIRGISQEWEGARSLIRCRTDPPKGFMGQVSSLGSI